jgi:hypothetical protein
MERTRIYEQWRQGSSGSGDPASSEYNSENAQVYENGTLGVRPGWKEITTSVGTRVHDPVTDRIRGLLWYQESDADEALALIFTDPAFKFDILPLATTTWAAGQTLPDVATTAGAGELMPPDYEYPGFLVSTFDGSVLSSMGPHVLLATSSSIGTVARGS